MLEATDIEQNVELVELVRVREEGRSVIRGEDLDLDDIEDGIQAKSSGVMESGDCNFDFSKDDVSDPSPKARELTSDDEEGEVIPANVFFPERQNILRKGEFIRFKKWGDDPCETVFAVRVFGSRVNLQRCECFQLMLLLLIFTWVIFILVGKEEAPNTLANTNGNEQTKVVNQLP